MNEQFLNSLVGKKWLRGARGPDAFDCWGIVVYWYKTQLNKALPDIPISPCSLTGITKEFTKRSKSVEWQPLTKPESNCIAVMGRGVSISHVGVHIGRGLVLHSASKHNGVIVQTVDQMRRQFGNIRFYKFNDNSCTDPKPV